MIFVGDGINDLVALSAADIGYAVGATDAMVAAAISTSHSSVAGRSHVIKTSHMPAFVGRPLPMQCSVAVCDILLCILHLSQLSCR